MSYKIHQIVMPFSKSPPYSTPSINKFFTNFEHIVWGEDQIRKLMIKRRDTTVLGAFDCLRPYAFKADLARYYLVYCFGGWYSDINNSFKEPSAKLEDKYNLIVFKDNGPHTSDPLSVQQSLFFSIAGSYFFYKVIDRCVENVRHRFYGNNALEITGPNLFGQIFYSLNENKRDNCLMGEFFHSPTAGFYFGKKLFATYKENGLKFSDSGIHSGNSYRELWHQEKIYRH
jgi:mannosyltransferase OCH1-like enzyme